MSTSNALTTHRLKIPVSGTFVDCQCDEGVINNVQNRHQSDDSNICHKSRGFGIVFHQFDALLHQPMEDLDEEKGRKQDNDTSIELIPKYR